MRRLGWGLVAVALLVVGARLMAPAAAPAADRGPERLGVPAAARSAVPPPTRVSLFGDSLAYQARAGFVSWMAGFAPGDLSVATFPGSALCDYRTRVLEDLLRRRPQVVVLAFSGNSYTACMRQSSGAFRRIGSTGWRNRYLDDLRDVLTVADYTETRVLWATAPPVHHPPDPDDYPRLLSAAARRLALTDPTLRVVDTGAALASDRRAFTRSLPCRLDEQAVCRAGRIQVRATDGLHFDCRGTRDALGACLGYSAGARRFGEALADAAISSRA